MFSFRRALALLSVFSFFLYPQISIAADSNELERAAATYQAIIEGVSKSLGISEEDASALLGDSEAFAAACNNSHPACDGTCSDGKECKEVTEGSTKVCRCKKKPTVAATPIDTANRAVAAD